MITKTAHIYIAKAIRNVSMPSASRRQLIADISEFLERDNPATFNAKLFGDIARGTLKDISNVKI